MKYPNFGSSMYLFSSKQDKHQKSIINEKKELPYLLYLIQIFEAVDLEPGLWGFGPALKCVNKTN